DARIGGKLLQHLGGAHAGVLLIANATDNDITSQIELSGAGRGNHHRGHATLHIVGTATIHFAVINAGIEWIAIKPRQGDGIIMPVEHQRFATATAPEYTDYRWPTGIFL